MGMFYLKNTELASETAALVFALFDLDGDQHIDMSEFREVCRFYLGHEPTEAQFQAEWARLDAHGQQYVTLDQYSKWLETSADPVFQRHASKKVCLQASIKTKQGADQIVMRQVGGSKASGKNRNPWNHRFSLGANYNEVLCPGFREYFSRPQSLPELGRHYKTHRGFRSQHRRLKTSAAEEEEAEDSTSRRHVPGGRMRHPASGEVTQWDDFWQPPVYLKPRFRPATCDYRCPGLPPRSYDEDDL